MAATKKPSKTVLELLKCDFDRLEGMVDEMRTMAKTVDQFPEDIEYTLEMIGTLDDVRVAAFQLANNCGAAIEVFKGK